MEAPELVAPVGNEAAGEDPVIHTVEDSKTSFEEYKAQMPPGGEGGYQEAQGISEPMPQAAPPAEPFNEEIQQEPNQQPAVDANPEEVKFPEVPATSLPELMPQDLPATSAPTDPVEQPPSYPTPEAGYQVPPEAYQEPAAVPAQVSEAPQPEYLPAAFPPAEAPQYEAPPEVMPPEGAPVQEMPQELQQEQLQEQPAGFEQPQEEAPPSASPEHQAAFDLGEDEEEIKKHKRERLPSDYDVTEMELINTRQQADMERREALVEKERREQEMKAEMRREAEEKLREWTENRKEEIIQKREQNKVEEETFNEYRKKLNESKNPWEKVVGNVDIKEGNYLGSKDVARMRQAMVSRRNDVKHGIIKFKKDEQCLN
eukprot:TRINITY_DN460_c0_g1_i18.p1 TRINITY_DN460_c0_g1~~TRINITY_DN460_c0_g1_i18.p1  ORF type:complete len:372 (-),score=128.05 TRINITY_DN460_c0_g1_i18:131-1246(-)